MLILPSTRSRKRLDVPHEPGEWIEVQRLAFAELPHSGISAVADPAAHMVALFRAAVVAWSYAEPVTPEHLACLDPVTAAWLYGQLNDWLLRGEGDQGNAIAPSTIS